MLDPYSEPTFANLVFYLVCRYFTEKADMEAKARSRKKKKRKRKSSEGSEDEPGESGDLVQNNTDLDFAG